jgi:hypothetical protein
MAGSKRVVFQVARQATVEKAKASLVALAKREHAKIMATDPRPARFTRVVDGVAGAREEAVKPTGHITYFYPRLDAVAQAAMEILFDLSPVLSGDYRNAHKFFLDGVAVRDLSGLALAKEQRITIINTLPYARKIEVGKMVMKVPGSDHVYEQAAHMLQKRFGNQAKIRFEWQGAISGGSIGGKKGNQSNLRYPALVISER